MSTIVSPISKPALSITVGNTTNPDSGNAQGMRLMQARVYEQRHAQYLLIKSPPASGKSRALMFVALDKLHRQKLKQVIIAVPERSIGSSFADEPLSQYGFDWDWRVNPRWNLCNEQDDGDSSSERSKVKAVGRFLRSSDQVLVCTHATFRFAIDELGIEAFDDRLIAIDEFHHVSSDVDKNRLGLLLQQLIARSRSHLIAMTGSYFRGDGDPVLSVQDEARFTHVTYSYYEQLNAYRWLKSLDICHAFYNGVYLDSLKNDENDSVLAPSLKTIIHIPSINARESTGDKLAERSRILDMLGTWESADPSTGFELVRTPQGRLLKVADLVDDSIPARRAKVLNALKDPAHKNDRDHVDIIIALGMAKEGFDWIWCEHALTIGYRSSMTELVQIIGRATRDAPGKKRARFTNLLAEPSADQGVVAEAVNDTLKAISLCLLMEQVMAPKFSFTPKNAGPQEGFDYGKNGYQPGQCNEGFNKATGQYHIEINGLVPPASPEVQRICREDLNDLYVAVLQDKDLMARAVFDQANTLPQETNLLHIGRIIRERYPNQTPEEHETIRQHMLASCFFSRQQASLTLTHEQQAQNELAADIKTDEQRHANTAFVDGTRRFLRVQDLDIDLIDSINPFDTAYAILARTLDAGTLNQIQASVATKRASIPEDEARELTKRALAFKTDNGRPPSIHSPDPWEQRMAQGMMALARILAKTKAARQQEASQHG